MGITPIRKGARRRLRRGKKRWKNLMKTMKNSKRIGPGLCITSVALG
jgi:hypothetical protein